MAVGAARTLHTLLYLLWLERHEEERVLKKTTVYFGRDVINDETVAAECKRTATDIYNGDPFDVSVVASPAIELSVKNAEMVCNKVHTPRRTDFSSSGSGSDLDTAREFELVSDTEESNDFTSDPGKSSDTMMVSERGIVVDLQPLPSMETQDSDTLEDSFEEMMEMSRKRKPAEAELDDRHLKIGDEEDFLF